MDGTDTELGSQVVPALFGYAIGMGCALWSFSIGGRVHEWIYDWSNGIKGSGPKERAGKAVNGAELDDDEEQMPPTSWDSDDSNVKCRHTIFSSNGDCQSSAAERQREKKAARKEKRAERAVGKTWFGPPM